MPELVHILCLYEEKVTALLAEVMFFPPKQLSSILHLLFISSGTVHILL